MSQAWKPSAYVSAQMLRPEVLSPDSWRLSAHHRGCWFDYRAVLIASVPGWLVSGQHGASEEHAYICL